MAKLTLADGTIIEGTPQELYDISQKFGVKADEPAKEIMHHGVAYTLVDRKAQEGDVVVFTGSSERHVTNGKPYEVVEDGGDLEIIDNDDDSIYVYFENCGRTESNTHVYAPKVEPLNIGDKVRILKAGEFGGVDVGQVGEVVGGFASTTDDKAEYSVRVDGADGDHDYFRPQDLRKATDEEVAEAKALVEQPAKDAVFTQAGRKPEEYRKGDIVRAIYVLGGVSSGHKPGNIGEVMCDTIVKSIGNGNPLVKIGGTSLHTNVEPITFVENRLN